MHTYISRVFLFGRRQEPQQNTNNYWKWHPRRVAGITQSSGNNRRGSGPKSDPKIMQNRNRIGSKTRPGTGRPYAPFAALPRDDLKTKYCHFGCLRGSLQNRGLPENAPKNSIRALFGPPKPPKGQKQKIFGDARKGLLEKEQNFDENGTLRDGQNQICDWKGHQKSRFRGPRNRHEFACLFGAF